MSINDVTLSQTDGHFITSYGAGEKPGTPIHLKYLKEHAGTRARFDRVSELIEGFETPFGMELVATVHSMAYKMPHAFH